MFSDAYSIQPLFTGMTGIPRAWALPLQFLAIVFLLQDRYHAVSPSVGEPMRKLPRQTFFTAFHGIIAFALFSLGTAGTGILVNTIHIIEIRQSRRVPFFVNTAANLSYATTAVLFCAMVDIVALTAVVRARLRNARTFDKVS